jgi:hypothetical protein
MTTSETAATMKFAAFSVSSLLGIFKNMQILANSARQQ